MPEKEKSSASTASSPEEKDYVSAIPPKISFPWLMFFLAAVFDLIGLIPYVNFFSEALAGLIFGFWQKIYSPKTDPVITFILAKIADAISFGILPSNIAIVLYAYWRKKTLEKIKTVIT
jgi:hypothetical protein